MSRQSEELTRYFDLHGIRQIDVAEKTGMAKTTISSILSGSIPIGKQRAWKLSQAYNFDFEFLVYGQGDLFAKPAPIEQHNQQGDNIGIQINTPQAPAAAPDPDAEFWKKKYTDAVLRIAVLEAENETLKNR